MKILNLIPYDPAPYWWEVLWVDILLGIAIAIGIICLTLLLYKLFTKEKKEKEEQ